MSPSPDAAIGTAPPSTAQPGRWLGVFDSGLGGLSVLRALRKTLPDVPMLYAADSAWAPYGERSDEAIAARSLQVAQALVDAGAGALVVACNTATATAVAELRGRWPELAIVGVEPGLKPALAVTRNRRIAVMATVATLRSARFHALLQRVIDAAQRESQQPVHVHLQPCPGLADAIERADLHCPDLVRQVDHWCALLRRADVDTVVLGCTHYPFVAPLIARALGPQVQLIDTAEAVARQAARRWNEQRIDQGVAAAVAAAAARLDPECNAPSSVRYLGSGELDGLRHAVTHWMDEADPEVDRLGC